MRPTKFALRSTLLVATATFCIFAQAQKRPDNLVPLPAIPPPPPSMVNDELEPQITISKRGDDKVEEHRINGKLYMMKVTPSHGVPYYLIDEKGDGNWAPKDTADAAHTRVPMWVIGTF